MRFFVHRNPALSGEVSRIFGREITRFYRERALSGTGVLSDKSAAPAQMQIVQRFGGKVNLHVPLHAVISDGVFALRQDGSHGRGLAFVPAPEPTEGEIVRLRDVLRGKILRRMLKLKAVR